MEKSCGKCVLNRQKLGGEWMDQFDFRSGRETRVGWGGDKISLCNLGWPGTKYTAQASVELTIILLPQPFDCWDYNVGHHTWLELGLLVMKGIGWPLLNVALNMSDTTWHMFSRNHWYRCPNYWLPGVLTRLYLVRYFAREKAMNLFLLGASSPLLTPIYFLLQDHVIVHP